MDIDPAALTPAGSLYFGRYTPKGSSKVWKHFFLLRDYPSKAFCSHCCADPAAMASGEGVMTYHEGGKSGTSSMKKHLERKHNLYLDPTRLEPTGSGNKSPSVTEACDTMSPYVSESPPPAHSFHLTMQEGPLINSRTHRTDETLLRSFVRNVIIGDLRPFQMVEDRGLREFLRDLHPNFEPEDSTSIRTAFNFLHAEIFRGAPSRQFAEEDDDAITLSGYGFELPLMKGEFIFGLVLSWIDQDWTENRMVCYATGDAESDRGSFLADILSKHGFPPRRTELFAMACDGSSVVEGSDMQATILPYGSSILKVAWNKILDGPEADPEVSKLLTKVRRLADFIQPFSGWNRSALHYMDGEEQPLELGREDSERLVTTLDLLRSVCAQKEAMEALLLRSGSSSDQTPLLLSDEESVTLSQLASVLDSLREAADILECQAHVRLSLFFPVLRLLLQKLEKSYPVQVLSSSGEEKLSIKEDQLQTLARTVRSRLREHLRSCLESLDEHQVSLMSLASALDPRFKDLKFLTTEEQKTVWSRVQELVSEKENADSKALVIQEPVAKRSKLASFFGDVVATEDTAVGPAEEMAAYRNMSQVLVTSDPLRWWQEHGDSFPRIGNLARRYLPIPTQRPQRSRVNSDSVRFLRTQMDRDTLVKLLFAHENADHW